MERLIDIDDKYLRLLRELLREHLMNKTVWAYGSRVKWNANPTSDLDLVVWGASNSQATRAIDAFAESNLPFTVQLFIWEDIPDDFKENIRNKYVVLQEEKNIPNGWSSVKLGDVANIIGGFAFKSEHFINEGSEFVIKIKDIKEPLISIENALCVNISNYDKEKLEKFRIRKGDYVVAMTGATIGKIGRLTEDIRAYINQRVAKIEPKSKADKNFIYYVIQNSNFQTFIENNIDSHSVQQNISSTGIGRYPLRVPVLSEQKAIAEVLGSLDDKIDLLQRQNKTLEDIAQTLFRKWFIEDADERWEKKPLSYFGNIICGKTPSKKVAEYFGGHIPFIKIPDMHGKTFVFRSSDTLSKEGRDSQKNAIIPPKSICVSCIATVGLVSMNAFESQTNQQINSVIPKKDEYRYYIYLFMKSSTTLLKAMASGGTATMNLNTRNFSEILLPVPSSNKIFTFHVKVKSLFDKMFSNQSQIRDIERLRDTLLPKLINGEVRVN